MEERKERPRKGSQGKGKTVLGWARQGGDKVEVRRGRGETRLS